MPIKCTLQVKAYEVVIQFSLTFWAILLQSLIFVLRICCLSSNRKTLLLQAMNLLDILAFVFTHYNIFSPVFSRKDPKPLTVILTINSCALVGRNGGIWNCYYHYHYLVGIQKRKGLYNIIVLFKDNHVLQNV